MGEREVSKGWRQPLEAVKEHRPWSKGELSSKPCSSPNSLCDFRHRTPISEPYFAHLGMGKADKVLPPETERTQKIWVK